MKKRTIVLLTSLVVLGLILIAMAPIWSKVILPGLATVSDDIEIVMNFDGTLVLNIDPNSFERYPDDQALSVPITIEWTLKSLPEKSTSELIAIDEEVLLKSTAGQQLAIIRHVYDMDRKTGKNAIGDASDQDREGYLIPIDLKPGVFESWDNEISDVIRLQFVSEETVDGEEYKDVKAYVFDITVDSREIIESPLGYPTEVTGAAFKEVSGNPALPVSDEETVPLTYFTTVSSLTLFEPITGIMVDTPVYNRTYYLNTSLSEGDENLIQVASLEYSRSAESVNETTDLAGKHAAAYNFARKWIPMIFLIPGVLMVAAGLLLFLKPSKPRKKKVRKKRQGDSKKSGSAEDEDSNTPSSRSSGQLRKTDGRNNSH